MPNSLAYPDLIITAILILTLVMFYLYIEAMITELSREDYEVAMISYFFRKCVEGSITNTSLAHFVITQYSSTPHVLCPLIEYDGSFHVRFYVGSFK